MRALKALLVLGVVAVSLGAAWAATAAAMGDRPATPGAVFLTVVVAIMSVPIHVVLHEAGHLAAALALRLPVSSIAVLAGAKTKAWMVNRTSVKIGLWGRENHVRTAPAPGMPSLRARVIALLLAGGVVNLATAAGCVAAAALVGPGVWRVVLAAVGLGAAGLAVSSVAPWRIDGSPSDGLRIVWWLKRVEGLRTGLMLEHLAWRARTPGNRWRRFEDLRPAPGEPDASDESNVSIRG